MSTPVVLRTRHCLNLEALIVRYNARQKGTENQRYGILWSIQEPVRLCGSFPDSRKPPGAYSRQVCTCLLVFDIVRAIQSVQRFHTSHLVVCHAMCHATSLKNYTFPRSQNYSCCSWAQISVSHALNTLLTGGLSQHSTIDMISVSI